MHNRKMQPNCERKVQSKSGGTLTVKSRPIDTSRTAKQQEGFYDIIYQVCLPYFNVNSTDDFMSKYCIDHGYREIKNGKELNHIFFNGYYQTAGCDFVYDMYSFVYNCYCVKKVDELIKNFIDAYVKYKTDSRNIEYIEQLTKCKKENKDFLARITKQIPNFDEHKNKTFSEIMQIPNIIEQEIMEIVFCQHFNKIFEYIEKEVQDKIDNKYKIDEIDTKKIYQKAKNISRTHSISYCINIIKDFNFAKYDDQIMQHVHSQFTEAIDKKPVDCTAEDILKINLIFLFTELCDKRIGYLTPERISIAYNALFQLQKISSLEEIQKKAEKIIDEVDKLIKENASQLEQDIIKLEKNTSKHNRQKRSISTKLSQEQYNDKNQEENTFIKAFEKSKSIDVEIVTYKEQQENDINFNLIVDLLHFSADKANDIFFNRSNDVILKHIMQAVKNGLIHQYSTGQTGLKKELIDIDDELVRLVRIKARTDNGYDSYLVILLKHNNAIFPKIIKTDPNLIHSFGKERENHIRSLVLKARDDYINEIKNNTKVNFIS